MVTGIPIDMLLSARIRREKSVRQGLPEALLPGPYQVQERSGS
jgi:hypothetical protein